MLKQLLLLLLPSLCVAQTKVSYRVFYNNNMASEGLRVEVRYQAKKASDSTYFHYSNAFWGEENLMNCVRVLKEENPGYTFKMVPDSNRMIVYHPRQTHIVFNYRIRQDYTEKIKETPNRPRLKNNYFHILGQSLFTVPEVIFDNANIAPELTAEINWVNFPSNFTIHNTFGTGHQKQTLIKIKLWSELYHSLFVGGDYRIYQFQHQNQPVYFVIRGQWLNNYADERIFAALQKTIITQRKFWNDHRLSMYTVFMTPLITVNDSSVEWQDMNGSGIKNGFLIQSSNNPFNSWDVLNYVLNHEMMHDWIGGKIKAKHEELNYWFTEGFTDYYTYKNRLRSNDITKEEWLNSFNADVLKKHWENPERNQPNYVIKDRFWESRNIEKIPYRRGAIFAFWLDNQMIKQSKGEKSLDDLMRELLATCETKNELFSDELFLDLVQKYLNDDLSYFFQKHLINGVDFDFQNGSLIDGFRMDHSGKVPVLVADPKVWPAYLNMK